MKQATCILLKNFCCLGALCALSLFASVSASASIDWGGGLTRFFGQNGAALNSDTGCAVLIAVSEGELIDFSDYIPAQPDDLVSLGAVLQDGGNVNRVVASSCFFYSGYLLYSAIPDVSAAKLIEYGVEEGDQLYLVVWDRSTFSNGKPTDRSYYTVQALFAEGGSGEPVYASLNSDTVYAQVAYPESGQETDQTLTAAARAGHNTYGDYLSWLRAQSISGTLPETGDLLSVDSDRDGRSDFEEYVLPSLPRIEAAAQAGSLAVSGVIAGDAVAGGVASASAGPEFVVELRGSDESVTYTAHASGDLSAWQTSEIYFEQGVWRSALPDFNITGTQYLGEGVWSVAMRYNAAGDGNRCFYKISVE